MSGGWTARTRALGEAASPTRGSRLTARLAGEPVADVAMLAAVPAWLAWPASRRRRLATVVALLDHRPALDRELRGAVIAPFATLTGDALFDAICALPAPRTDAAQRLPTVGALPELGERLLRDALPPVLGGAADPYLGTLVRQGEALLSAEDAS